MDSVWAVAIAIIPSIGIGFLFYKVMKAILEGDRNERLAQSRWEATHSAEIPAAAGNPAEGVADQRAR